MGTKICLDTDIAIAIINGDKKVEQLVIKLSNHSVHLTSITIFELLLRETNLEIVHRFINDLEVIPFKEKEAVKASSIFKELKKKGLLVEMRDIFIAASCIANDCPLVTFNKKHFEKIGGLSLFDF